MNPASPSRKIWRFRWPLAIFLAAHLCAISAAATTEITEPFSGIRHIHRSTTVPRTLDLHLVEIDLTVPGIDFEITPSNGPAPGETEGQTTRQFLVETGAQVAINGSFSALSGGDWVVEGIAAVRGDVYSDFEQFRRTALNISFDNIATIIREDDMPPGHFPPVELYNTLGGEARLLNDGNNVAPSESESLQPRTAVGISQDGRKLFLLTVDGRNSGHSLGVTRPEAADLLRDFGAWNAINLDGGGSSTLVMADPIARVVNIPVGISNEPGTERTVGSNFAVRASAAVDAPGSRFVYDDFEGGDEGFFGYRLDFSGSTQGIDATSSQADAVNTMGHESQWSQRLVVRDDPMENGGVENPAGGWFVRHLSGVPNGDSPGTRDDNVVRPATGKVGFWALTSDPGVTISLAIDSADDVTADRGIPKPLIPDGQWHVYEWNLEDFSEWEGWFSGSGLLDYAEFTLDSIQILGPHADAVVFLDDIFHEARPLTGPGGIDLNQDGFVDGKDFLIWERNGASGADYAAWETHFGHVSSNCTIGGEVPEPTAWSIFFLGAFAIADRTLRGNLRSRAPTT